MNREKERTIISNLIHDYCKLTKHEIPEQIDTEYSIALIESLIEKVPAADLSSNFFKDKQLFTFIIQKIESEEKWITSAIVDGIMCSSETGPIIIKPTPSHVIASGLGLAPPDPKYKNLVTAMGVAPSDEHIATSATSD